jgi:hypothetical protein
MMRIVRAAVAREMPKELPMSRTVMPALLAATMLTAAGAQAAKAGSAGIEPTTPCLVRELAGGSAATVAGTILEVAGERFVLADAEGGRLRVEAEDLALDGLAAGQMITVAGRLDEDEFKARAAIREDGSPVAREEERD